MVFKSRGDRIRDIVNLNLFTVLSQVLDRERINKYADVIITKLDAANGIFLWQLTDTQTATFPDLLYYDILFVDSSGDRHYYFEGQIFADEGYSA